MLLILRGTYKECHKTVSDNTQIHFIKSDKVISLENRRYSYYLVSNRE